MMCHEYQLDTAVLKTTEPVTLWQSEKGRVEIGKDSLALAVKSGDRSKGYVFHGDGKLLIDTIVETEEGAFGKPVEKELKKPFLMLGNTEEVQKKLSAASDEDLTRLGYESREKLVDQVEDLFHQFFGKRTWELGHHYCGESHGSIFAFPNEAGKPDILLLKGSKLVYRSMGTVFLLSGSKTILKSPEQIVLSSHRKSLVVNR